MKNKTFLILTFQTLSRQTKQVIYTSLEDRLPFSGTKLFSAKKIKRQDFSKYKKSPIIGWVYRIEIQNIRSLKLNNVLSNLVSTNERSVIKEAIDKLNDHLSGCSGPKLYETTSNSGPRQPDK